MTIYVLYFISITILFILLIKYRFIFSKDRIIKTNSSVQYNRQMLFFMVIASLLLILIIGFRSDHQGLDLYNSLGTGYFYYYLKINEDSLIEILRNFSSQKYANYEIGFVLLCKLLGTLCSNQQILLVICALLAIAPTGYFIYKNSKNKWLSVVLFLALPLFATVTFSAIRQGIAIGIVLLSYTFVKEKRPVCFILTVALACTFHSTAIVAFAAYPVYHLRVDRKNALVGGVGSLAIIYLMKEPLFWILARLVHNNPTMVRSNSVNLFLALTLIYIVCTLFYKEQDYEVRGYINIFLLACGAQSFASLHNLAGRIMWYFMSVLIVLIPNLLANMNIKEKQIIKPLSWVVGILAIFLGLYYFRHNSMALAYPYIPFWRSM